MTATITYDARNGKLVARDELGACHGEIAGEPIDAGTDSWSVVDRFEFPAEILSVDHDREFIHVTFAD